MISPITPTERRQFYTAATVALGVVVAFEVVAVTSGLRRWPDLFLPFGMLCLTVESLIRERHASAARYLMWGAYPLLAAAIVYAGVRAFGLVQSVAG